MSRFQKGLMLAVMHLALVLTVAGKYYADRAALPRAWARAAPFDQNLPIRGRYVRLRVEAEVRSNGTVLPGGTNQARLSADGGKLAANLPGPGGVWVRALAGNRAALVEPIAYFIPEHVADPSRRPAGEELWVELSVPPIGAPRPLRLGVKKDGVLRPLDLN